jgi:hypothetical protein
MQLDRRLLIDGKLLDAERTYPSLNPATGEVLGHAPDATGRRCRGRRRGGPPRVRLDELADRHRAPHPLP